LNIRVVHHTQYLLELAQSRKLLLKRMPVDAVYHDPCELSRDIRIYDEPRDLLGRITTLQTAGMEKENTLCCGNSLANITSSNEIKNIIARDAYNKINKPGAQYLVTSCPMCKKAFGNVSDVAVKDISEMVILSLQKNQRVADIGQQKIEKPAEIMID
jgi:Fe-S oxidoreductase